MLTLLKHYWLYDYHGLFIDYLKINYFSCSKKNTAKMYAFNIMLKLVSCLPLKLGTWIRIPVGAWLKSLNAWMRGEEITSCKSDIAPVSLTDWCIMILKKKLKKILCLKVIWFSTVHINSTVLALRSLYYTWKKWIEPGLGGSILWISKIKYYRGPPFNIDRSQLLRQSGSRVTLTSSTLYKRGYL